MYLSGGGGEGPNPCETRWGPSCPGLVSRRKFLCGAPDFIPTMTQVNVRYMVNDIGAAVAFYTTHLGFALLSNTAPAFADVTLGDLCKKGWV